MSAIFLFDVSIFTTTMPSVRRDPEWPAPPYPSNKTLYTPSFLVTLLSGAGMALLKGTVVVVATGFLAKFLMRDS
jgi:hypothetical protein